MNFVIDDYSIREVLFHIFPQLGLNLLLLSYQASLFLSVDVTLESLEFLEFFRDRFVYGELHVSFVRTKQSFQGRELEVIVDELVQQFIDILFLQQPPTGSYPV